LGGKPVVEEERGHARPDAFAEGGRDFDPDAVGGEVGDGRGVVEEAKVGDHVGGRARKETACEENQSARSS
jgi:hypothetical protein